MIKLLRRVNAWLSVEMNPWGSVVCTIGFLLIGIAAVHLGHPMVAMVASGCAGVSIAGPIDHAGKLWKARHDRR